MRFHLGLLILLPSLAMGDCIQTVDPLRPTNSILPQSQACGQNVTADGNNVIFSQIPKLPVFTASQINNADLSKIGAGGIAGCSTCLRCHICVSTGSVTGQTDCDSPVGGGCN